MDEEVCLRRANQSIAVWERTHLNMLSHWQEAAVALAEAEAAPAQEERQTIYNTDALHDKLEDISWSTEHSWVETLVVTHAEPTQVDNVDDDLARELAFYNQVGSTPASFASCQSVMVTLFTQKHRLISPMLQL